MKQPTLIVITGNSGSGKTTLARQLSAKYRIPYVSKDSIKEHIFDALSSQDKAWSRKVSAAAHRIMDDSIAQTLGASGSIIVESNFKPGIDSERFARIVGQHNAACIQILCHADGDVLFERWNDRIATGQRHRGHVEEVGPEQIKHDLSQPYQPLQLPGQLIQLDTSDVRNIQLPEL